MQCILLVYTLHIYGIICVYTPPGGWFCGGGQGPIPLAPPAITSESPGRVISFILLEQERKCHTGNIPGIYQVIQVIYQMQAIGQAAESGCRAGPEAIYSTTAL
jgi:hypothetical protein